LKTAFVIVFFFSLTLLHSDVRFLYNI